jgi:hypothetical protein
LNPAVEGKMHEQRARAVAAEAELKVTSDAFAKLKDGYVSAWMNSDPRDTTGREKLWLATTIISKVQSQLLQAVADGVVADKEIDRKTRADEIRRAGQSRKFFDFRL